MAPVEEVLPSEGQQFMKEVSKTKQEKTDGERQERVSEQSPATTRDDEGAQNQINTTA